MGINPIYLTCFWALFSTIVYAQAEGFLKRIRQNFRGKIGIFLIEGIIQCFKLKEYKEHSVQAANRFA